MILNRIDMNSELVHIDLLVLVLLIDLQWQMTEVDKFCNKYHLNSINFTLPEPNSQARQNLYRHVLFDDQQKLIFTYIPKVK